MTGFEKFIYSMQTSMPRPEAFGWFHLLCWVILIISSVLVILFRKRISLKGVRITVLIIGIVCIIMEIYKQLVFSYSYNPSTEKGSWDYQWYAFPFQFCSTPIYIMVIAGSIWAKESRFREYLYSYLATYAFFAGLSVMVYTGDVFTTMIGINIQTMFVHGAMPFVAILLWATGQVKYKLTTILKALSVFAVMVTLALVINVMFVKLGSYPDTFNMFFISPYFPCTLIILDKIYLSVPYIVFLLIYIIGFTLAAFIMLLIPFSIAKICEHVKKKKLS